MRRARLSVRTALAYGSCLMNAFLTQLFLSCIWHAVEVAQDKLAVFLYNEVESSSHVMEQLFSSHFATTLALLLLLLLTFE